MQTRRTTVVLDEDLYRQAKRVALEQDKTFKEVMEEALRSFLNAGELPAARSTGSPFHVYPGRALTDLRRETLYRTLRR